MNGWWTFILVTISLLVIFLMCYCFYQLVINDSLAWSKKVLLGMTLAMGIFIVPSLGLTHMAVVHNLEKKNELCSANVDDFHKKLLGARSLLDR